MNPLQRWLARRALKAREAKLYEPQPDDGPYVLTAKGLNARDFARRINDPDSECWRDGHICTAHLALFDSNQTKCEAKTE